MEGKSWRKGAIIGRKDDSGDRNKTKARKEANDCKGANRIRRAKGKTRAWTGEETEGRGGWRKKNIS
jgi:hypothetical protein